MNTLRMLTVGMLLAAAASAAAAGEEPSIETITITAKRHTALPATAHEPPRTAVEIAVFLPTDMPEAEIDYHLTPIGASPAPAVERATL
jgi:hypothetical protein